MILDPVFTLLCLVESLWSAMCASAISTKLARAHSVSSNRPRRGHTTRSFDCQKNFASSPTPYRRSLGSLSEARWDAGVSAFRFASQHHGWTNPAPQTHWAPLLLFSPRDISNNSEAPTIRRDSDSLPGVCLSLSAILPVSIACHCAITAEVHALIPIVQTLGEIAFSSAPLA